MAQIKAMFVLEYLLVFSALDKVAALAVGVYVGVHSDDSDKRTWYSDLAYSYIIDKELPSRDCCRFLNILQKVHKSAIIVRDMWLMKIFTMRIKINYFD